MANEAIAQGAVLASILAGFAFVGSTAASRQSTIIKHFTAGMLMLASVFLGFLKLLQPTLAPTPTQPEPLTVVFALPVGIGLVLFIDATTDHIDEQADGNLGTLCRLIGLGTVMAASALYIFIYIFVRTR
jgi:hypothetical protein